MEVEAALPPAHIRLNSNLCQYAFRALKLSPTHPIQEAINKPTYHLSPNTPRPIPPKTQLERIRHSIQELVDLDSLEHIQHFKYPPWKRITPYSVTISSLPKD
jgi:hypothetical protein